MSDIEFIGFISNNNSSETIVRQGPVLDPVHIETVAKAHENAGFDRALLAFHSTSPDSLQVAQHVLGVTSRLNVLIAQRPGFTAPTLLARQFAVLDQFSRGRVALHVITGGNAAELRQDGNTLDDKSERYARTSEFLDIVRSQWTSEKPFSYAGKYYQVENAFAQLKPYRKEGIRIYFGGASDAAIDVAGRHADTYALWGESYAQVREQVARVSAAAARHGRPAPRFSLSVRPILAETEEKAWAKAQAVLERATALQDQTGYRKPADGHATDGAKRLLAIAEQGKRVDKRLWTEIAKLTGANSNTTALVGTPEQVAEVFGDYYDLGISHFLIRGFDPLIDAIEYGRELIPATRQLIAARQRAKGVALAQVSLRVGDQKGNSRAVMEAAGVLKDVPYTIEWKEFVAAAPLLEALSAGAIETGLVGDAPFTFAAASGVPVKAIAAIRQTQEGLAILVPETSRIRSFDDLKGKTIATGRGSIGHQLVLAALESRSWTTNDIQLVFLPPSDAKVAYTQGSVDAWSTWEPYVSQEEVLFKSRRIITGEGLTPGLSFQVATPAAIKDKRAALEDFVQRLTAARAWSLGNVESYAETWGRLMNIPPAVPLNWLKRAKVRIAPIDDSVVSDEQRTIDLYTRSGLIKERLDAAAILDRSFAAAIAKGAGL